MPHAGLFYIQKSQTMSLSSRRQFMRMGGALAASALGACASGLGQRPYPPIVFVHGNGDTAALWQTTAWRFESNGWPSDRLFALDLPYPLARDDDNREQAGRSSTTQHMAALQAEVEHALKATGASQVVLVGNSRGGNAIRNYIQNGGGSLTVSHAILGGTPNHGIQAIAGLNEGSEFSGTGPFLRSLNVAKNPAGDEVSGQVKWLTIRSDHNDKFAQPEGRWIGMPGKPTGVTTEGPALKGATNAVIAGLDHRETSYSAAAFSQMWSFLTGRAPSQDGIQPVDTPVLQGKLTGLGLNPLDSQSGNYVNNLPLTGAQLTIYAVDAEGQRQGQAVHRKTTGADGLWGPFTARTGQAYEFVIQASGYAVTHIYRSAFLRSSAWVHLRAERFLDGDRDAASVVIFTRPRGYFDAQRDHLSLDGSASLPGVPSSGTAGVSSSRLLLPAGPVRTVKAEFNGERLAALNWPRSEQHLVVMELSF
jgi:pimeloyl-ACP methyl ester carboxylesterase